MHPELLEKLVLNNFCKFSLLMLYVKLQLHSFPSLNCFVCVYMTT
jgi:hypothetical protein